MSGKRILRYNVSASLASITVVFVKRVYLLFKHAYLHTFDTEFLFGF